MVVPKDLNKNSVDVEMCPHMTLFQDLAMQVNPPFTSCWTRYLHAATMGRTVPGLFLATEKAMCHSVSLSQGPQTAGTSGSLWTLSLS